MCFTQNSFHSVMTASIFIHSPASFSVLTNTRRRRGFDDVGCIAANKRITATTVLMLLHLHISSTRSNCGILTEIKAYHGSINKGMASYLLNKYRPTSNYYKYIFKLSCRWSHFHINRSGLVFIGC